MSNYESHDLLRSNQQVEEGEATSTRAGTNKSSRKNKSKTKKSKKGSSITTTTKKTKVTEETEPTSRDLTSERSALRERTTNEQAPGNTGRSELRERITNAQVQDSENENVVLEPNNTEQENEELVITNKDNSIHQITNNQGSFIWNYLEKLSPSGKYKKRVKCLVPVIGLCGEQPCGHIMGTDGSTGNFINHLAKHRITRNTELSKDNTESIEKARYSISNPVRKNRLDKKFVGVIIKDNQPLSIRDDEGFKEFVEDLDPHYELPSDKKVKELLVKSYNYCKQEIVCLFEQGVTSCSLTLDLWTSKSRAGYLGVTCSFVNAQFEFHEAILAIRYLKYPHTSDNICECLNQIINEWNLGGKVFTITTDNGSNMVKAGKTLFKDHNITRFPCAAHTLQLVIGKGLIPAEKLVARAKRLINFFTTPKQTERLVEVQKNMNNVNQHEVKKI